MDQPLTTKTVLGWSEYVSFPHWGIDDLHAKVDTGARSSALHVDNLVRLKHGRVQFEVVLNRHRPEHRARIKCPVERWSRVRSSNGEYHLRPFVKVVIRLGPVEKEIELSLVSREKMIFRMLLGRTALAGDFIVDVSARRALGERHCKLRSARIRKTEDNPPSS